MYFNLYIQLIKDVLGCSLELVKHILAWSQP